MNKDRPLRWTKELVDDLVQRATTPGVTTKQLADHYHVTVAGIHYVIHKYCDPKQLREIRRELNKAKRKDEYKRRIAEALRASGGRYPEAARALHFSYSTFSDWVNRLFTEEELIALFRPRACVVCGKKIADRHPNKKTCNEECARQKDKANARKWRARTDKPTWNLWQERDYEMVRNMILQHRGRIGSIAKELGLYHRSVQSAIRRWGLEKLAAEQRQADFEERMNRARELVDAGMTIRAIGREIGMNETDTSIHLRARYGVLPRVCRVCGKSFVANPPQRRCCSKECVKMGDKIRTKRAQKRYDQKLRSMKPQKPNKPIQPIPADVAIAQRIEQIYSTSKHL